MGQNGDYLQNFGLTRCDCKLILARHALGKRLTKAADFTDFANDTKIALPAIDFATRGSFILHPLVE